MEQLIQQLRTILGTNFHLYLKSHSFHWNVEGRNFAQDHAFLGDLYTAIFGNVDIIAEKIRMLNSYAPTGMVRMLELSDIEDTDMIPEGREMFAILAKDNERLMYHIRAGIAAADQANEPAISNFLQDILDQHTKHAWMLRSLTK